MLNSFNAVDAKISSMTREFLSDEDFFKISKFDSTSDVIEYLRNSPMNIDILKYVEVYEIEEALAVYKYNQVNKLKYFLNGAYKEFLDAYLNEIEIDRIKKSLRKIKTKSLNLEINLKLRNKTIKLRNPDFKTFVDSLKETIYYKFLNSYKNEDSSTILFYMEMNLDKLYFLNIYEASKGLSKKNRQSFSDIFGVRIDLLNIIWIYRGISFYSLMPEELINFTLLGGKNLNFETLKKLSYVKNIEEFKNIIRSYGYGFLFEGENIDLYLDRRASRYIYYNALKNFKKGGFTKLLCYLFILEYEIHDVSTILESTRFNLNTDDKLKYLIRNFRR